MVFQIAFVYLYIYMNCVCVCMCVNDYRLLYMDKY